MTYADRIDSLVLQTMCDEPRPWTKAELRREFEGDIDAEDAVSRLVARGLVAKVSGDFLRHHGGGALRPSDGEGRRVGELTEAFGERLVVARFGYGRASQETTAVRAGIHRTQMSALENGSASRIMVSTSRPETSGRPRSSNIRSGWL